MSNGVPAVNPACKIQDFATMGNVGGYMKAIHWANANQFYEHYGPV
jgi:hypothetical protein